MSITKQDIEGEQNTEGSEVIRGHKSKGGKSRPSVVSR